MKVYTPQTLPSLSIREEGYYATQAELIISARPTVFLGGSIDMGNADKWQDRFINKMADLDVNLLNPRRDDWDSSWVQDPTPGTQFHEQVSWEMSAQSHSDFNVYYFADGSQSPITLLELGIFGSARSMLGEESTVIVYCTPKFWRYGNVKFVCDQFGITCYEDEEKLLENLRKEILHLNT